MILVGVILKRHPASDMSRHNGYNTSTSRKSQAHWNYAQKIAPGIYIFWGRYLFIVEIAVSIILLILHVTIEYSLVCHLDRADSPQKIVLTRNWAVRKVWRIPSDGRSAGGGMRHTFRTVISPLQKKPVSHPPARGTFFP